MPEYPINTAILNQNWFGLRPPADAAFIAAWGCRAILSGRRSQLIDVVPDRQSFQPDTPPVEFARFLRNKVAPWLERNCDQRWIEPSGRDILSFDAGPMHARACPNGCHGYLYVGAWMDAPVPETGST